MNHNTDKTAAYTYDVLNRRTGETRSSAPARAFDYDLVGQLTAVNQSGGNATFAYDAVGNRISVTGAPGAGSYTANNINQYTTAGGMGALTYDANGNLATANGWTYTHNGNSRLVGVSGPGSVTATFGRDGRNRGVKRTINGTTTYLIYDGWNLVAEYDADGDLTTQYIHGPQVDEILAKVTSTSTTFPLPDALGSTIAVTDASGAVLERVFYSDAFGTPTFKDANGTPLAGTSTGTRFLFTGREWLAALSLYDYRNRTYSAEFGRFIETDPIGFKAGDVNLYRYVSNSPANMSDPIGLYQTVDAAGIGGAQKAREEMAQAKDGLERCASICKHTKTGQIELTDFSIGVKNKGGQRCWPPSCSTLGKCYTLVGITHNHPHGGPISRPDKNASEGDKDGDPRDIPVYVDRGGKGVDKYTPELGPGRNGAVTRDIE